MIDYITWAKEYEEHHRALKAVVAKLHEEKKRAKDPTTRQELNSKIIAYNSFAKEMSLTAQLLRERANPQRGDKR